MTKKGKRRTWRKLLSALLVMGMLLSTTSTSVFAADLTDETPAVEEATAQPESVPQPETLEEPVSTPDTVFEAVEPVTAEAVIEPTTAPTAVEPGNTEPVSDPNTVPATTEPGNEEPVSDPNAVPAVTEPENEEPVNDPNTVPATTQPENEEPVNAANSALKMNAANSIQDVPEEENAYADISEFYAAIAEMGDAMDEESTRAVIEKCLAVYNRLSPEDQAAEAEAYAYILSYAEDLGQSEIEPLAYDPSRTIYLYTSANGGSVAHVVRTKSEVNGKSLDYIVKTYFPTYYKEGNTYKHREHNYGSWFSTNKIADTSYQDILIANWHEHNYVWKPISDTQHQLQCDCGDTKGNPQNHNRSVKSSTPATCHSYSSTTYYCSTCGYTWTEYGNTYASHTWGGWYNNGKGQEQRDCNFDYHHEYRDIQTQKFKVTYKDGESTIAEDEYEENALVTITRSLTNRYLDFIGWSDDPDATTANYPVDAKFVITKNMTLYAVWQIKNDDNGNGISITKTRTSVDTATKGQTIKWTITVTNNSNVTKTVTLNEKLEGAYFTSKNRITLTAGESKDVFVEYTVKGSDKGTIYNTVVASTDKPGEDKTATDNPGTKISGKYKVQWFDDKGNSIKDDETRSGSGHVSVTDIDKNVKGYEFLSTDLRNMLDADVKADDSTVLKLYFSKQTKQITVTWMDGYSSTPIKSETVAEDISEEELKALYPKEPTREEYRFDGWDVKRNETTGNITITAKWTPKDNGNGINVEKVRVSINGDEKKTSAKADDVIKWSIKVTNNSNVAKTVTLTEDIADALFENGQNTITVTVAPDTTDEYFVTYTVKATDNGSITNTVKAATTDNENAEDSDDGTPVDNGNGINVEKVRVSINDDETKTSAKADDVIKWSIKVTNNSNVTKTVTLTEDIADALFENGQNTITVTVAPDTTDEYFVTYTVKATDNGSITNTVKATTTDNENAEDSDDGTPVDNGNGINIEKVRVSINDDETKTSAKADDVIKWSIKVTNNSNVTKTVTLTEDIADALFENGQNTITVTVAPDTTDEYFVTYTVKATDNGSITNTVKATTTDNENAEDSDDGTLIDLTTPVDNGNGITVAKTRTSADTAEVGDTITWDITVTNNSNVTKTVTLTDQLTGVTLSENTFTLAPGASRTVTASYVVQAANAGTTLYNTVAASTGGNGPSENPEATDGGTQINQTTPVDNGNGISITKTRTSDDTAAVGDTVTWDIEVTNNSNVTKTITLTERLTGAALSDSTFTLAPGASRTVTASYVVQAADAGTTLYNTVAASTGGNGDNENPEATDEGTSIDSEDPTPENPTPENPTPENPTPDNPTPDNPTPDNPTPDNPTPDNPTPGTPDATPDATPGTPAAPAPAAPAPAAPVVTPAAVPAAVPAAAPAAPVVTPPAAPAATPVVEVADEDVPLADQDVDEQDDVREVVDEDVPLAKGLPKSWALLNLILAILTVLASGLMLIFYFIGKKNEEDEEDDEMIQQIREDNEEDEEELKRKGIFRLLSIIPAVVSVIFFILTEDMRNPMIFVDKWTLWMVVFAAANVILAVLSKKKRKEDDDDDNKQKPNYGVVS